MQFVARPPSAALRDVVEYVWSLHDAPAHTRERIVPSGTVELVFNLAEDEFRIYRAAQPVRRLPGAIVSGCYRMAFDIDTREHASLVGVHFRPGGAGVLGIPAGELGNTHASLDELWGSAARELRAQLIEAAPARRHALIEAALLARRGRCEERPVVAAARAALDRGEEVGDVARLVDLSRRRLIELFRADVGMTPKRYARVRRFQRPLALTFATRSRAAPAAGRSSSMTPTAIPSSSTRRRGGDRPPPEPSVDPVETGNRSGRSDVEAGMMCRIAACGRTGHLMAGVVAMGAVAGLATARPGPRAASPPAVIAAPAYVPQLRSIRETIHEVESWPGCGVVVFATRVRYDDVSVIVPCIELVEKNGPRFAVGDTHELVVDECDEVRAILWRGRRYPLDGFPTVIAPASLTEFTMRNDYETRTVRYDAPGWHWPPPSRVDAATAGTGCAGRR